MLTKNLIKSEQKNEISTITFGSPKSNSMPKDLLTRLAEEIIQEGKSTKTKMIVLQSYGEKTFCAGASFDELLSIRKYDEALAFFSGFGKVINAARTCPKIIIGRIQGKAVGGGVGLAAMTDYTFATESASIRLSELSIGIGPFVIAPIVKKRIGVNALRELTLDTEWRTAQWALENGLYNRVFRDMSTMDEAIEKFTRNMTTYHTQALVELKQMFWTNTEHWEELLPQQAEKTAKLSMEPFVKEIIAKLKKK